jgi:hypothetical protein
MPQDWNYGRTPGLCKLWHQGSAPGGFERYRLITTVGTVRYSGCVSEPHLTVIGVYRPVISAETCREQWQVTGDDGATQGHFGRLVLIEAVTEGLSGAFDFSKFGQMQPDHPDDPRYMQVGYDEGLLSSDGETLIQRKMGCVQGTGSLRFAVYLHLYDPLRPLQWQYGQVICPPVQDVPARLMMLMPYTACD